MAIARQEKKPNKSGMPGMQTGTTNSGMPDMQTGTASRQATLRAARGIQAELPQLEATAPANLQAAVRTFVAAEKPYSEDLIKADGDQSKLPPTDMAKSMSALNGPEGKAVTGYWSQTCGIDLGPATSHK